MLICVAPQDASCRVGFVRRLFDVPDSLERGYVDLRFHEMGKHAAFECLLGA